MYEKNTLLSQIHYSVAQCMASQTKGNGMSQASGQAGTGSVLPSFIFIGKVLHGL
jgi:hypothetical protein